MDVGLGFPNPELVNRKELLQDCIWSRKLKVPGSVARFDCHFRPSGPPKGSATASLGGYTPAAQPPGPFQWLFSTHSRRDYCLPFNTDLVVTLTQNSLPTVLNLENPFPLLQCQNSHHLLAAKAPFFPPLFPCPFPLSYQCWEEFPLPWWFEQNNTSGLVTTPLPPK